MSVFEILTTVTIGSFMYIVVFPIQLLSSIFMGWGLLAIPILACSMYFYIVLELKMYFLIIPILIALGVSFDSTSQQRESERKKAEWVSELLNG